MSAVVGPQGHKSSHTSPRPTTYVQVVCVCLHGTVVAGGVATSGRAMFPAGGDGSIRTVDVSLWVVANSACGDDVSDCASWEVGGGVVGVGRNVLKVSSSRASESGSRVVALGRTGVAPVTSSMCTDSWGEFSRSAESSRVRRTLRKGLTLLELLGERRQ